MDLFIQLASTPSASYTERALVFLGPIIACAGLYQMYARPKTTIALGVVAGAAVGCTVAVTTAAGLTNEQLVAKACGALSIGVIAAHVVVVVPLAEEWLKRAHPLVTPLLSAHETLMYGDTPTQAASRMVVHACLAYMPHSVAIWAHAAINVVGVAMTAASYSEAADIAFAKMASAPPALLYVAAGLVLGAAWHSRGRLRNAHRSLLVWIAEQFRLWPARRVAASRYAVEGPIETIEPDVNHPHGVAAAARKALTRRGWDIAIALTGRLPWMVQASRRDRAAGLRGETIPKVPKDYAVELASQPYDGEDCIMYNDVEFHHDPSEFAWHLAHGRVVIIVTPRPAAVGGDEMGITYYYDRDNHLHFRVDGAHYHAPVYNWHVDVVSIEHGWWGHRMTSAKVERARHGMHDLITLLPMSSTPCWLGRLFLDKQSLDVIRPIAADGSAALIIKEGEGPAHISIGRADTSHSVTIPLAIWEQLELMYETQPKTTAQHVATSMKMSSNEASYLLNCLARKKGAITVPWSFHRTWQVVERREANEPFAPTMPKPCLRAFATSMTHFGFAPAVSLASEAHAISKRVREPSAWPEVTNSDVVRVMPYIREFVDCLTGDPVVPFSIAEVCEIQERPAQRAKNAHAASLGSLADTASNKSSMFSKSEAIAALDKATRCVTTDSDRHKLELARYVYAIADFLKRMPWFAPGMSCEAVAERMLEIDLQGDRPTNMTDFDKQDATEGVVARVLCLFVAHRALGVEHYAGFLAALRRIYRTLGVRSAFGIMYNIMLQMASGRMTTSEENTTISAFVAFVSYRMEDMPAAEAYRRLGIYGGDDGYDKTSPHHVVAAARLAGMRVSCAVGEPPNFLARFLARGSHNTYRDIVRALTGFNLTALPVETLGDCLAAAFSKTDNWYLSDANTPIIGDIVEAAQHVQRLTGVKAAPDAAWHLPGQYYNEVMPDDCEWALERLRTAGFSFRLFYAWKDAVLASLDPTDAALKFLHPPLMTVPEFDVRPGFCVYTDHGDYFSTEAATPIIFKKGENYELIKPVEEPPQVEVFAECIAEVPGSPRFDPRAAAAPACDAGQPADEPPAAPNTPSPGAAQAAPAAPISGADMKKKADERFVQALRDERCDPVPTPAGASARTAFLYHVPRHDASLAEKAYAIVDWVRQLTNDGHVTKAGRAFRLVDRKKPAPAVVYVPRTGCFYTTTLDRAEAEAKKWVIRI